MKTQDDADDFIDRLKAIRVLKVSNPKKVAAGDVGLLKGMNTNELKATIEHIKGLSFDSRVEVMRNIVDNLPMETLKHTNCKEIFSTFKSELEKI
jgi:hypothetical protein